jgi:hypothetical protein
MLFPLYLKKDLLSPRQAVGYQRHYASEENDAQIIEHQIAQETKGRNMSTEAELRSEEVAQGIERHVRTRTAHEWRL